MCRETITLRLYSVVWSVDCILTNALYHFLAQKNKENKPAVSAQRKTKLSTAHATDTPGPPDPGVHHPHNAPHLPTPKTCPKTSSHAFRRRYRSTLPPKSAHDSQTSRGSRRYCVDPDGTQLAVSALRGSSEGPRVSRYENSRLFFPRPNAAGAAGEPRESRAPGRTSHEQSREPGRPTSWRPSSAPGG